MVSYGLGQLFLKVFMVYVYLPYLFVYFLLCTEQSVSLLGNLAQNPLTGRFRVHQSKSQRSLSYCLWVHWHSTGQHDEKALVVWQRSTFVSSL